VNVYELSPRAKPQPLIRPLSPSRADDRVE